MINEEEMSENPSEESCDDSDGGTACANGKTKGGKKAPVKKNKYKIRRDFVSTMRDLGEKLKRKKPASFGTDEEDRNQSHQNVRMLSGTDY